MYNKFKCYKSGMIKRKENILKDLSSTYFTVEKLNQTTINTNPTKKEKDEIVEDFEKQDIEKLKPLEKVIEKIFKDNFTYKYKKTSLHRSYIQVELNRQLNQKEKSLMLTKVNKDNHRNFYS